MSLGRNGKAGRNRALRLRLSGMFESRGPDETVSIAASEQNVDVKLTSGFLLEPEQSTPALMVHHPQAKYFVV
jgi:hypothetical protein